MGPVKRMLVLLMPHFLFLHSLGLDFSPHYILWGAFKHTQGMCVMSWLIPLYPIQQKDDHQGNRCFNALALSAQRPFARRASKIYMCRSTYSIITNVTAHCWLCLLCAAGNVEGEKSHLTSAHFLGPLSLCAGVSGLVRLQWRTLSSQDDSVCAGQLKAAW